MDLYTFADPEAEFLLALARHAGRYPDGTTYSTSYPKSSSIGAPHIQFAWDGTPSDEAQREFATMRVTVWGPKGQRSVTKGLASLVQAVLLDYASDSLWRVTRGLGRTPGVDPQSQLPFVTFTLTAETRPSVA